jgi:nucleobase:cation symporter-1, NCS1 family
MTPFFDVAGFYDGAVSKAMSGADISMFIGLPVAAIAYWLFGRRIDVDAERVLAVEQSAEIETAAAHALP